MGELREMFEIFDAAQRDKTNNQDWLADRESLYDEYLKIDADKIINCVLNTIKNAKEQLEKLQKAKEERIQGVFNMLF
jgi:uncharacterized protein with HEPN domain